MHTIGLLGGMSWESTRIYYKLLNEGVRERLGGLHSAKLILHSFDFAEIAAMQHAGEWDALGKKMAEAALAMEKGGAEAIIICTNLMHKLAPYVEEATSIPLLHIADAVAAEMKAAGQKKAALLGAGYTMRESFYADRLAQHGLEVIIPEGDDFDMVHNSVYEELCQGKFEQKTLARYVNVIARLQVHGADCVILGCTEIPLLIHQEHAALPLHDTTTIHANAALRWMFDETAESMAA